MKRMLIDAVHAEETRVVVIDGTRLMDYDFVSSSKQQIKGNIYLAKITRVEPSLQAAFVEYGGGKQGFLPFAEIHPDYYQIPVSDRIRLMQEAMNASDDDDQDDLAAQTGTDDALPVQDFSGEPIEVNQDYSGFTDNPDSVEDHSYSSEEVALPPLRIADSSIHVEGAASQQLADEPTPPAALEATDYVEKSEIIPNFSEGETSDAPVMPELQEQTGEAPLPQAEEVQTLAEDETIIRPRKKQNFTKRYKIQEVIKRNQIVLVQVIKEERGNKGVSLTTFISLAGRYCVLMPNSPKDGGISRKIANSEDRRRLKQLSAQLKVSEGMSAIIRTAGMERTETEITRDYEYLVNLWNTIRELTISSTAPALIYEEGNLAKRAIRDLYHSDIEEIWVQGEVAFEDAKEFMKTISPSHAPRVKLYKDPIPLFYQYDVEDQMVAMHDTVVRLRSGGYIVINPTEALISIDVNSGRATGERNIEETASKTNLEAAHEIARQLRLRDLAGLIVIDFIDMLDSRNRRSVERTLKDALKSDRAKIQIGRISPFGLLEMSRQRLHPSVSEMNTSPCPHCNGKGVIRSDESISIQLIRALERDASLGNYFELRAVTTSSAATHLFNCKRDKIAAIEQKYNVRIAILIDESMHEAGFRIEKLKVEGGDYIQEDKAAQRKKRGGRGGRGNDERREREPREFERAAESEIAEREVSEDNVVEVSENGETTEERDRSRRRRRNRGGRGRDRERGERRPPVEGEITTQPADDAGSDTPQEDFVAADGEERSQGEGGPRRGRRNRGGRRRWKDRPPRPEGEQPSDGGATVAEPWNGNREQSVGGDDNHSGGTRSFAPSNPQSFEPMRSEPSAPSNASYERTLEPANGDGGGSSGSESQNKKGGWWRRIVE